MRRLISTLRPGHELTLHEGSVAFFPALIEAIESARDEVLMETYIADVSGSTVGVMEALEAAAHRGVKVRVTVDGVGSKPLSPEWAARLHTAGVAWRVFAPLGIWGLLIPSNLRRLHRKLVVVDQRVAFCGGINLLDDYIDPNHGPLKIPRLDYTVQVTGPLVAQVHDTMTQAWRRIAALQQLRERSLSGAMAAYRASNQVQSPEDLSRQRKLNQTGVRAALVLRDNLRNRSRIERSYRRAIGGARQEIIIANAYFLPGRKLRKALITAALRGVRVQVLLQGRYEYFMQYFASRSVYAELLLAGVEIHEYAASFLHAKVAVIDGHWATVGSSNLDPLSLLLAREANVVVDDPVFAGVLRDHLMRAMATGARVVDVAGLAERSWRARVLERLALGLMRLALLVTGSRY